MDELALDALERMEKTLQNLKITYNTLRTGRANVQLLDRIEVSYYGDKIPLNQISSITVPEPRQLIVKPYDRNDLKAIVAAINTSDLSINPIVDGDQVRLIIPALTEETRRDLAKKAKVYAEDAKVAIRNIRREYIDLLRSSDEYSDDLRKRIEADIQKVTDDSTKKVEEILQVKEKEIMSL
ncbi:MAG: ribosome recycling factor [Bacilli bacterium]|jgi:ribosome recycling factor|nr:ribosome recycling factor [Bacilli bacterium]NLN79991.1 ribosome recycling factor [Erysipelotrichia bacterium]